MSDEATTWAEMVDWHLVKGILGDFMERVDRMPEGVDLAAPPRFMVIRETWDRSTVPPTREIHELEVMS